eukprot:NODE_97_length_20652_cov_0.832093.p3 type:complete len:579 gc:universal NODE_97_length_20652_cov_0.832093:5997-4261(-)
MKSLVIGKLYPLHAGHEYLIRKAFESSDEVLVIICYKDNEYPSKNHRVSWVTELFPLAQVRTIYDVYDPDDSQLWANLVKEIANDIDIVFTSEKYGDPFSKYLGCRHICVDIERKTFPISGTQVRNNPRSCWQYLSMPVRHFYMQRYVIVGSESTWKSTIAEKVSKSLDIPFVPEYGREYYEKKIDKTIWTEQDFLNIRKGQLDLERGCADSYELVCDTDTATTLVWAKRYLGHEIKYDVDYPTLYLISELKESVFVQDGTRDDLETGQRQKMEPEIIDMVQQSGKPFVVLTGTLENRVMQAIEAIQNTRNTKKVTIINEVIAQNENKFSLNVLSDLKSFNRAEIAWVTIFALASILFSFFDLRSLSWWTPDQSDSSWRSFIFLTSGIASFSGVLCVVLVAKRLFSNFFWGIINCIFYGVFSISFGYVGNFQLNILFFLPLQFVGAVQWKSKLVHSIVERNPNLKLKYWAVLVLFGFTLCLGLYYEIREFAVAVTGVYAFEENTFARSLDALTTSLSVCAQILLSFRYSEQWYVWILVNILQIIMFSLPDTLSINILIMWSFFLLNSFYGLYCWMKIK